MPRNVAGQFKVRPGACASGRRSLFDGHLVVIILVSAMGQFLTRFQWEHAKCSHQTWQHTRSSFMARIVKCNPFFLHCTAFHLAAEPSGTLHYFLACCDERQPKATTIGIFYESALTLVGVAIWRIMLSEEAPFVGEKLSCDPPCMHAINRSEHCIIIMSIKCFSCLEARCVCGQAAVKAAKILHLAGLTRSKQDPINHGYSAQCLYRPPPAGAKSIKLGVLITGQSAHGLEECVVTLGSDRPPTNEPQVAPKGSVKSKDNLDETQVLRSCPAHASLEQHTANASAQLIPNPHIVH